MKKASDLYSLTRRELILLDLLGRKILSEDDSMKYLREIKKD